MNYINFIPINNKFDKQHILYRKLQFNFKIIVLSDYIQIKIWEQIWKAVIYTIEIAHNVYKT